MRHTAHFPSVLLLLTACGDRHGDPATLHAPLTAEQCSFFAENDRVTVCHHTASKKNPYVVIRTNFAGCAEGHAGHDGDYVAYDDPTCRDQGCYPETAPVDGVVPCCEGLGPVNGYCRELDACALAPCGPDERCTDLPAPALGDASGRTCEPTATCGNRIVEGSEVCDDGEKNGADPCGCTTECDYGVKGTPCEDGSSCSQGDVCSGTGKCAAGESPCKPGDLCKETDGGFECHAAQVCGNGTIEGSEQCDKDALGGATCATLGLGQGDVRCTEHCTFDTGKCWSPCGNGYLDDGEECDLGKDNGRPGGCCTVDCVAVAAGEACDDGEFCTATDRCSGDGKCVGTDDPCAELGLRCDWKLDTCDRCGDGVVEGDELCDDGAANGTSKCGCGEHCKWPGIDTACEDGLACTLGDGCDGAGQCTRGEKSPCAPGALCHETADGAICALCGDGKVDFGEACDDGADNGLSPCGCSNACTLPTTCDDGNACTVGDACAEGKCRGDDPCAELPGTACVTTDAGIECQVLCGNGKVDKGEECDAGADNGASQCGCSSACTLPKTCDDGDPCTTGDTCVDGKCGGGKNPCDGVPGTYCAPLDDGFECRPRCGNGKVDDGEDCDDGEDNGASPCGCSGACSLPQTCDDGDPCTVDDTCSGDTCAGIDPCAGLAGVECVPIDSGYECRALCGNGRIDEGEDCDAGGDNATSACGCGKACTWPTTCDDEDPCTVGDTCSAGACVGSDPCAEKAGFECVPADTGFSCVALCGNARLDPGEQCDHGGQNGGGCCTKACEDACGEGFDCVQRDVGSQCEARCGNGRLDAGEECDWGNGSGGFYPQSMECACTETCGLVQEGVACIGDPCMLGNACLGGVCQDGGEPRCTEAEQCVIVEGLTTCRPLCDPGCGAAEKCVVIDGQLTCIEACDPPCGGGEECFAVKGSPPACRATCGNLELDPGEDCDPPGDPAVACDCSEACTLPGSTTSCDEDELFCTSAACDGAGQCVPTSTCTPSERCYEGLALCSLCGNGVIDPGEDCDGPLGIVSVCVGDDCSGFPAGGCAAWPEFDGGTLTCTACTLDTTQCALCGNGVQESGEFCDHGDDNGVAPGECGCNDDCTSTFAMPCDDGTPCTEGDTCDANLDCVGGDPCAPGTGCVALSATEHQCVSLCGNGVLDEGEECEGTSFLTGGSACASLGAASMVGGELSCTAACTIDLSQCQLAEVALDASRHHICWVEGAELSCLASDLVTTLAAPASPPGSGGVRGVASGQVATTGYSCALFADGTASCFAAIGTDPIPADPPDLDARFVRLATQGGTVCGVKPDLSLYCWGFDATVIAEAPASGTWLDVAVGTGYGCALATDGTVTCWGPGPNTKNDPMPSPTRRPLTWFTWLSAGVNAYCARASDGVVACDDDQDVSYPDHAIVPGRDDYTLPLPADLTDVALVDVGTRFGACALTATGAGLCWGMTADGATPVLPSGLNLRAIARGDDFVCAEQADTSIACWD